MTGLWVGDWRLTLRPDLGGAIGRLTWRGRDVLRPTPDDAADALAAACFPLVPYANRIARGRFVFEGQAVDLGPTPGFEPHALHGVGWRRPWSVETVDARSVVLGLDHTSGGDWPWAFSARETFELGEAGLRLALSMTNTDVRRQPAGLGLHPYFTCGPGDRLGLSASGVWLSDETLIPVRLAGPDAVFDWTDAPVLETAPFVDHAYAGWDGRARLHKEGWSVSVKTDAGWAHVYAPQGEAFVCVEPVTHRPDALNAPPGERSGLAVLAPGETLSVTMSLSVGALDQIPGASGNSSDM